MARTDAILNRLLGLHPKIIDLSLGRIARLLGALGDPHKRLPPVIHVAGTNGKGSVIAFLRAMLEADGKRVHVYTSPHLVAFRERIRLSGKLVSAQRLNRALETCETVNGGQPITYFEITTAAAFLLFAEVEADYLLLEVGLGGRLDATNMIEQPLASVIAPVSIDHTQFLGDTLEAIAAEKAGILKRGVPAIIGRQPEKALDTILNQAARLGITPRVAGQDFDGYGQNGRLVYQDETGLLDLPPPRLFGSHQIDNAALAIATLRAIAPAVCESAIAAGLRRAEWPARLTRLSGSLTARLPAGSELWLDGGHNRAGAEALARALADMAMRRPTPLVLIAGMLANKDAAGFFDALADCTAQVFTVPIAGETGAFKAAELAAHARAAGLVAQPKRSLQAALDAAATFGPARVVIAGSLYLAGLALKQNKTPPD